MNETLFDNVDENASCFRNVSQYEKKSCADEIWPPTKVKSVHASVSLINNGQSVSHLTIYSEPQVVLSEHHKRLAYLQ